MTLNKRSTAVLMQLINNDSYLSIDELTTRINVSRRTIYNDISKINDWLGELGLQPIKNVRSLGFILPEQTKKQIPSNIKKIQAWHYEYSPVERRAWIFINLVVSSKPLYLENLMDRVRVSRNTTIEDLKVLRDEVEKINLQLIFDRTKGYVILGEEVNIRKAIVYYLSEAFLDQNWNSLIANVQFQLYSINKFDDAAHYLIDTNSINLVYTWLFDIEKEFNIQFTDEVLYSLSLRFIIFSIRVLHGNYIMMDSVEKEVLSETEAFKAAKQISARLEEIFFTTFPEDEQFYLTTHLLGARVNYSEDDFRNFSLSENLREIAKKMVDNFEKNACILFQERDMLIKNLLLHLKPAYYRIKYGIEIENTIVDSVKTKYEEVFLLTKKVVDPFEKFVGTKMNDREIAYIAIHFGGWLRKESVTPVSRKKALIVCANGIGTSQILKQQLEGLFPTIDFTEYVSIRDYEKKNFDVDLVISTTPIVKKQHPTIIINPILTDVEKEKLLKKVNVLFSDGNQKVLSLEGLVEVIQRHADILNKEKLIKDLKQYFVRPRYSINQRKKPSLEELLNLEMIQVENSVPDWKQSIIKAAEPLLNKGCITNTYINEMINNVKKNGPYIVIAPKIAVPHAKPEYGVKKIGMSMLKVKEAVSFSNQPKHDVHFIIVLATVDDELHLKALSQLTQLFSNHSNVKKLMTLNSVYQIHQFINQCVSEILAKCGG